MSEGERIEERVRRQVEAARNFDAETRIGSLEILIIELSALIGFILDKDPLE